MCLRKVTMLMRCEVTLSTLLPLIALLRYKTIFFSGSSKPVTRRSAGPSSSNAGRPMGAKNRRPTKAEIEKELEQLKEEHKRKLSVWQCSLLLALILTHIKSSIL